MAERGGIPGRALTPEQEVVLNALCSGPGRDARTAELLRCGLHWEVLRSIALYHGVLPVVATRLERIGSDLVPRGEAAVLRELRGANARRSLLMTAELLRILGLFAARGIDAIPLKGPVLAVQAYGDSGLRQFVDLDILVRQGDLLRAREALVGQGYEPRDRLSAAQERSHLKRANELTYTSPNGTVILDLHWRYAAAYFTVTLDTDALFARKASISLDGHEVPALAVDDLVLYLCFHGAFHRWKKLSALSDLARLLEAHRELDWQSLLRKAEAAGLLRACLLGIAVVRDILDVEVPDAASAMIDRDRGVRKLRQDVRAGLFGRMTEEHGFLETAWFQIRAKDGLRDRLRYCRIRALYPTVEDWKLISLADSLYFLYFVIRPLRLTGLLPDRRYPKNN